MGRELTFQPLCSGTAPSYRQIGEGLLQGAYCQASLPREVMLANSSTTVPRIRWARSKRFVTTQARFGITRTRSPTPGPA